MLVRPAEYARHRGVSKQAVHKAIKSERIPVQIVGGVTLVDVEAADASWAANTDPSNAANSETGQPEISKPLKFRTPAGEDAGGQLLLVDVPETSRREAAVARQQTNGTAPESKSKGAQAPPYGRAFASARADREKWQAEAVRMRVLEAQGELVRADQIARLWSQIFRRLRDRLVSLPDRTAPLVLGLSDAAQVRELMARSVDQLLAELVQDLEAPAGEERAS